MALNFFPQPVFNIFGEPVAMSTPPSPAHLERFDAFAQKFQERYTTFSLLPYREAFINRMDDGKREGFLSVVEKYV